MKGTRVLSGLYEGDQDAVRLKVCMKGTRVLSGLCEGDQSAVRFL